MFRPRSIYVGMLMFAITLGLIGCGGASNSADSTASPGGGNAVRLKLTDKMAFEPSSLTVQTNERVTVELENAGTLKHNFTITVDGQDVSQDVAPGRTEQITFTAPSKPGQVAFYCDEPGHRAAGMSGVLVTEQ